MVLMAETTPNDSAFPELMEDLQRIPYRAVRHKVHVMVVMVTLLPFFSFLGRIKPGLCPTMRFVARAIMAAD